MATTEELHEPIDVLTLFADGTLRPVKLRWNGRVHPIERVAYQWVTRDGTHPIRHFAVALDTGALCEITLHTHSLRWTLCKIQMD